MPLATAEVVEAAVGEGAVEEGEVAVAAPVVGEAVVAAEAAVAAVVGEAAGEVVAQALAAAEPVDLAPVELVREQVPGQEQELEWELAAEARAVVVAVAVLRSEILTAHTDGLTRTGSARECLGFKGALRFGAPGLGAISLGLAAGLVPALILGSPNVRSRLGGMCGGTRRACAISTRLATLNG